MTRFPSPTRVLVRGLVWTPALGGAAGLAVWEAFCLGTFSVASLLFAPFAVAVGIVVGVLPGVTTAAVLALAQQRTPLRPAAGAAVAAAVGAGLALDLALLAVLGGHDVGVVATCWAVGSVLLAGVGAVGGLVVLQPERVRVSARPTGAAAAAGTASPGWSRGPGR